MADLLPTEADLQEAARSGLVPKDDVRLTINLNRALHYKLKLRAAKTQQTIGAMIEDWIRSL